MFALIKGGITPSRPASRRGVSQVEDRVWALMERCWSYESKKRPKCDEIQRIIADLNVVDNRPPVDDGAAFLNVKRVRSNIKINYKQVYEILQQAGYFWFLQLLNDAHAVDRFKGSQLK